MGDDLDTWSYLWWGWQQEGWMSDDLNTWSVLDDTIWPRGGAMLACLNFFLENSAQEGYASLYNKIE
jgi:hypothetical protein